MSFKFLNRISSKQRISGITTSTGKLIIASQTGASPSTPGDGYQYYTWSSGAGPVVFGGSVTGAASYPKQKSRSISGNQVDLTSANAYIECHGGSPGPTGGKSTATFTATTLTSAANFYVDISGGGSPNGGNHAGFFITSKTHGNTYLMAGGAGSPAPATGNPGGNGGGSSGSGGASGGASGGPGPSSGGGGGTQVGGGGGGSGAPDRSSGNPGSALAGGSLGGGDASGRPGGGGGSGYYGGGAGGSGYAGDNNNPGSGGGGGSGYVHPSASGGTNSPGSASGGPKVVVRVLV